MQGSLEYHDSSEPMTVFGYCIIISLVIHLLLALGVGWFFAFHPQLQSMSSTSPKLTVTLTPQSLFKPQTELEKKYFATTEGMREVKDSSPNALFESDRNTAATSIKKGIGDESLPELSGRKAPGLQLFERQTSIEQKASTAGSQGQQQNRTMSQPQQEQQTTQQQKPITGTIPILPPQKIVNQMEQRQNQKTPPIKQPNMFQSGQTSSSMPAQAQFAAKKSDVRGGATVGKEDSLAAKKTLEGEYKSKIYKAIGSRWYAYVQNRISLLNVGGIQISFEVNSRGKVQNIRVTDGNEKSTLADISRLAILETSGQFGPFSEELKKEVGDTIQMSVNFSLF